MDGGPLNLRKADRMHADPAEPRARADGSPMSRMQWPVLESVPDHPDTPVGPAPRRILTPQLRRSTLLTWVEFFTTSVGVPQVGLAILPRATVKP